MHNHVAQVGGDGKVAIWSIEMGTELVVLTSAIESTPLYCAFSPDGNKLAVTETNGNVVGGTCFCVGVCMVFRGFCMGWGFEAARGLRCVTGGTEMTSCEVLSASTHYHILLGAHYYYYAHPQPERRLWSLYVKVYL